MAKATVTHARVGTVRCTCGRQFDRTAGRNMHVTKANKAASYAAIAEAHADNVYDVLEVEAHEGDPRDDVAGVEYVDAPIVVSTYLEVDDAIAAHEAEFAPLDLNAAELAYRRAVDEVLEADRAYAAAFEAKELAERRRLDADNALAPAFAAYRSALASRIG